MFMRFNNFMRFLRGSSVFPVVGKEWNLERGSLGWKLQY
jgi:hypothetical protein